MKNIYEKPTVFMLALNAFDIIASSAEELKEITHDATGGIADIVPY